MIFIRKKGTHLASKFKGSDVRASGDRPSLTYPYFSKDTSNVSNPRLVVQTQDGGFDYLF